jgi:hypothetical protein
MAIAWNEVEQSPEYEYLSPQNKVLAKKEYWDSVVSVDPEFDNLLDSEKLAAKYEFFGGSTSPEEDVYSGVEKQNIIGKTFNVPGAAVRSLLQGKGYIAGAVNPSDVRRFQDLAIEGAQQTTSPLMNAVLGMPASALGLAADVITNPADVLLGVASGPVGSAVGRTAVGKAVSKAATSDITPLKWVKEAFRGTKKAEEAANIAKKDIIKSTSSEISALQAEGTQKKGILSSLERRNLTEADAEARGLASALNSAERKYRGKVSDESFTQSREVRKELPKLFAKKSEEYIGGLRELVGKNPVKAKQSEVVPVIEDSLLNHGILQKNEAGQIVMGRSPITQAENKVFSEWIRLKNASPEEPISISELVESQIAIRPKFGKQWGSSEHLQAQVSEGLSEIIAAKAPEVAAYRRAYAPFLDWKKAAIKEFQPFSGGYKNKSGARVLSKYADVNQTLTADEAKLMSMLEKLTEQDFTSGLKKLRPLGRDIKTREEAAKIIKANRRQEIQDSIASKKSEIDNMIQAKARELEGLKEVKIQDIDRATKEITDNLRFRRRSLGIGALGTSIAVGGSNFLNYIRNRLSYQTFGITN